MKKTLLLMLTLTGLYSCTPSADEIVEKAMEQAGADQFDGKEIRFDFRDKHYRSYRKDGRYLLERSFQKDSMEIRDVLTNDGFERFSNDSLIAVADSMAVRYSNSVNSVHYFAYLPYGLNAQAVNKELLGKVRVNDKPYYKVKVWFDEQGGGSDYEDVFLYWIGQEDFQIDYLAYEYHTNGGGIRFREAFNRRNIDGIDFVDYRNYKPAAQKATLFTLDSLYMNDGLELLSLIELKDVKVGPCEDCK
ncbi:DUF6503 family protein [Robertkochia flava]|uniref:DUF6503 family protein n=1 Tax=Robertkochia flava TaxID=3447986 RepID=UPI001CCFA58C|nr:DUF6503 family protein [Robertkochia marina]